MPSHLKAGPAFHYNDTSVVVIPGFRIDVDRIGTLGGRGLHYSA